MVGSYCDLNYSSYCTTVFMLGFIVSYLQKGKYIMRHKESVGHDIISFMGSTGYYLGLFLISSLLLVIVITVDGLICNPWIFMSLIPLGMVFILTVGRMSFYINDRSIMRKKRNIRMNLMKSDDSVNVIDTQPIDFELTDQSEIELDKKCDEIEQKYKSKIDEFTIGNKERIIVTEEN